MNKNQKIIVVVLIIVLIIVAIFGYQAITNATNEMSMYGV